MNDKNILNYIKILSNNQKIRELLINTIGNILLKQNDFEKFIKENENKIIHIRDWITSVIENNEQWKAPRVLTIEALNNAADKYFNKKNNKLKNIILNETDEKLIANLDDFYIIQMLTPQALDNESKQMQHCIGYGYYDQNLRNKKYLYLSLRDKFNKAHVTLEIENQKILQIQGKQNKLPDKKYLEKLLPWLIKNQYEITQVQNNLFFDKKSFQLLDREEIVLKNNIDYIKTIDFKSMIKTLIGTDKFLFKKHYNLQINNLKFVVDFTKKNIKTYDKTTLRNNAILKNKIFKYLIHNDYKNIPYIDFGYIFNKNDNKIYSIHKLPNHCIIDDNLDLDQGGEAEFILGDNFYLPNNLTITGNACFSALDKIQTKNTKINILGNLNLTYCYLDDIDNIDFKQGLYLYKTSIKKLPNNLVVNGNFIIKHTKIDQNFNNIIINGDLYCENISKINFLENSIINGTLSLKDMIIKKIPDNITIKDNLILKNVTLDKIPKNLKVKNIYINRYNIPIIEETINFEKIYIYEYGKEYTKEEFCHNFKSEINSDNNQPSI